MIDRKQYAAALRGMDRTPRAGVFNAQGQTFGEFAQGRAQEGNQRAVRTMLDDMGVPAKFGTRWDPQWDYGKVSAAAQAAGRPVTARSWQDPAYNQAQYQSPFGQHMAGLQKKLEAIPMEQGGLREPKGGFPAGLFGMALGLATGSPWLGRAISAGGALR